MKSKGTVLLYSEVRTTMPILMETFIPIMPQYEAYDYIAPDDNRRYKRCQSNTKLSNNSDHVGI